MVKSPLQQESLPIPPLESGDRLNRYEFERLDFLPQPNLLAICDQCYCNGRVLLCFAHLGHQVPPRRILSGVASHL